MNHDHKFFADLAQNLVDSDSGGDLPKRYLMLIRRRTIIKRITGIIRKAAKLHNELSHVGFKAPLSIAGETSSIVMVRAEALDMGDVPVAREYDDKGRHRGTSLADISDLLFEETGRQWTPVEVMDEYDKLMRPCPEVLEYRVPQLSKRISEEMRVIEGRLREFVLARDTRIFHVATDSSSLQYALEKCQA